ncbi:hypothetical protein QGN29_04090 [Temperatibacter marinus]|uniref:Uncharacterized protein n=1 Tax=Temperatibacter marinus TaxID=1456591 RepID=A0AA52EJA0_9PROT|nr:hypothetical protein [Temperatibacter marinus]WND03552.1 hypothetical protein QGN29_04090 [Temperatibacter marinus]
MDGLLLIKLLHLIAFVYWLGGDLGTFYASRFVTKEDLSSEARSTALTIMMGCDQGPRFAMPLIFPLGFELAVHMGYIDMAPIGVAIIWLVSIIWVATVITLHFAHGKNFIPALTTFDFYLRICVVIALLSLSGYALATGTIILAAWTAYKIIVFALLVACGLMIRIKLRPFMVAWGSLMTSGPTDAVNAAISGSIAKARPYVWAIWIGLFVNAALGLHLIG